MGGAQAKCGNGQFKIPGDLQFHSTLNDIGQLQVPKKGPKVLALGAFTPSFAQTPYGGGVVLNAEGHAFSYPTYDKNKTETVVDPQKGAVDFCFKPDHDSNSPAEHVFFQITSPSGVVLEFKKTSNYSEFALTANEAVTILYTKGSYSPGKWTRFTVNWEQEPDAKLDAGVYLDGLATTPDQQKPDLSGNLLPKATSDLHFTVGDSGASGDQSPGGVIDELRVMSIGVDPVP